MNVDFISDVFRYGFVLDSAILGFIEGLTEFIPVSSTAHLVLASHFLGFHSPNNSFQIMIQLGAVLAVCTVYFHKIWLLIREFAVNPAARYFVFGLLLAFFPAVIVGILLHDMIKTLLLESPRFICCMLIIGGGILLWLDRLKLNIQYRSLHEYSGLLCFKIGLFQCLAMIPGVSRSGATIVGALLLGADKRSATEFSFFLAMPTMMGAFGYDLFKNYHRLSFDDGLSIVIGFIMAFITGLLVVRYVLDYISRHGFALFGWWRIIFGIGGLIALAFWG